MTIILKLEKVTEQKSYTVGGKASTLHFMSKTEFHVPPALCLGVSLNHQYGDSPGLLSYILMEFYLYSSLSHFFEDLRHL
jgi:phosphoenolpyruvate synthase/pyruvate phosphate dikinase